MSKYPDHAYLSWHDGTGYWLHWNANSYGPFRDQVYVYDFGIRELGIDVYAWQKESMHAAALIWIEEQRKRREFKDLPLFAGVEGNGP